MKTEMSTATSSIFSSIGQELVDILCTLNLSGLPFPIRYSSRMLSDLVGRDLNFSIYQKGRLSKMVCSAWEARGNEYTVSTNVIQTGNSPSHTKWMYATIKDSETKLGTLLDASSKNVDALYLPHNWRANVSEMQRSKLRKLVSELPADTPAEQVTPKIKAAVATPVPALTSLGQEVVKILCELDMRGLPFPVTFGLNIICEMVGRDLNFSGYQKGWLTKTICRSWRAEGLGRSVSMSQSPIQGGAAPTTFWLYRTEEDAKKDLATLIKERANDVDALYFPHNWRETVSDLELRRNKFRVFVGELRGLRKPADGRLAVDAQYRALLLTALDKDNFEQSMTVDETAMQTTRMSGVSSSTSSTAQPSVDTGSAASPTTTTTSLPEENKTTESSDANVGEGVTTGEGESILTGTDVTWHADSSSDTEARRVMTQQITELLEQCSPDSSNQEGKLSTLSNSLEAKLYKASKSRQEYMDEKTLRLRVRDLIKASGNSKSNNSNSSSSHSNSSNGMSKKNTEPRVRPTRKVVVKAKLKNIATEVAKRENSSGASLAAATLTSIGQELGDILCAIDMRGLPYPVRHNSDLLCELVGKNVNLNSYQKGWVTKVVCKTWRAHGRSVSAVQSVVKVGVIPKTFWLYETVEQANTTVSAAARAKKHAKDLDALFLPRNWQSTIPDLQARKDRLGVLVNGLPPAPIPEQFESSSASGMVSLSRVSSTRVKSQAGGSVDGNDMDVENVDAASVVADNDSENRTTTKKRKSRKKKKWSTTKKSKADNGHGKILAPVWLPIGQELSDFLGELDLRGLPFPADKCLNVLSKLVGQDLDFSKYKKKSLQRAVCKAWEDHGHGHSVSTTETTLKGGYVQKSYWLLETKADTQKDLATLIKKSINEVDALSLPHNWRDMITDLDVRRSEIRELLNELPGGVLAVDTGSNAHDDSDRDDDAHAVDGLMMFAECANADERFSPGGNNGYINGSICDEDEDDSDYEDVDKRHLGSRRQVYTQFSAPNASAITPTVRASSSANTRRLRSVPRALGSSDEDRDMSVRDRGFMCTVGRLQDLLEYVTRIGVCEDCNESLSMRNQQDKGMAISFDMACACAGKETTRWSSSGAQVRVETSTKERN